MTAETSVSPASLFEVTRDADFVSFDGLENHRFREFPAICFLKIPEVSQSVRSSFQIDEKTSIEHAIAFLHKFHKADGEALLSF